MDAVRREAQVRRFVDEVWNARNYEAAADLYGEGYVNPFGICLLYTSDAADE